MKILISSIVDLKRSAPSRIHFLIKYLSKNHKIALISPKDIWKARQVDKNGGYFDYLPKINIYHPFNLDIAPVWQELFSYLMRSFLKKIKVAEFDIHFSYNSLGLGLSVSNYLKKFGIKTVYDLADHLPAMVYHSPQLPPFLRLPARWLSQFLLYRNIQSASWVTLSCRTLGEELGVPLSKSSILPNGIDLSLFKKFRKKTKKATKRWLIVYSGVLREWVDFKPIFKAIKLLSSEYQLTLEIAGKEGDFQKVLTSAKKIGVADKIKFLGTLPYYRIPQFLSRADIAILPFKENDVAKCAFPLKLLEYIALGLPVISTPLPEVKNLLGSTILYARNDNDWANALVKMFKNYPYHKSTISKKFALLSQYDWEFLAKKLEKILLNFAKMKLG